jgi:Pyruvate/2-oxoacid:ferredoxin oxidoreductase delta subunit
MSQVFIHYYSGTGNTKRAVDLIADEFKKNGDEVRQFLIGKGKPQISGNAALNLFAFPVLSWSAPAFVKKYVRQLPKGKGAKAAVCAVCAGGPVQALQNMERILKRKQFDVFLTGSILYPDNWTQMMNPPNESDQKEIIRKGDTMALEFAANFVKGERRLFRSSRFANLITGSISILFELIGSRYLGKTYIADSKCNQCGICVKTCPVNTIRMKGFGAKKPFWSSSCQDCGRCINICPQKAIQVSIPRLFLHMMINIGLIWASIPLAGWASKALPPGYQAFGWIVAFIMALAIVLWAQLAIIDRLFFLLEQIPGIGRFFEWSFTRKFRRYTAPGFKPMI